MEECKIVNLYSLNETIFQNTRSGCALLRKSCKIFAGTSHFLKRNETLSCY